MEFNPVQLKWLVLFFALYGTNGQIHLIKHDMLFEFNFIWICLVCGYQTVTKLMESQNELIQLRTHGSAQDALGDFPPEETGKRFNTLPA